jgi:hypothetical protein
MTEPSTRKRTELAHRSSEGLDVTLFWVRQGGEDKAVVSVSDRPAGAYFEIPAEPHLALDVYYHPFAPRHYWRRRSSSTSSTCS